GVPPVAQLGTRLVLLRERLDDAQDVVELLAPGVAQLAHGHVEGGGHRPAHALVGPRLVLAGPPPRPHRGAPQRVEQDGLAHAPQPGEDHRALGAAPLDAFEHDLEAMELLVAAGELGRPLAGAGGVGVSDRIHHRTVCRSLAWRAETRRKEERRLRSDSLPPLATRLEWDRCAQKTSTGSRSGSASPSATGWLTGGPATSWDTSWGATSRPWS